MPSKLAIINLINLGFFVSQTPCKYRIQYTFHQIYEVPRYIFLTTTEIIGSEKLNEIVLLDTFLPCHKKWHLDKLHKIVTLDLFVANGIRMKGNLFDAIFENCSLLNALAVHKRTLLMKCISWWIFDKTSRVRLWKKIACRYKTDYISMANCVKMVTK